MSDIPLTPGSDARPAIEPAPGISLRRLLSVTTITPGQAALLARDLATEAARRVGKGRPPASLDEDSVWISSDGTVSILDQPALAAESSVDAAAAVRMVRGLGRRADTYRPRTVDDSARPLIELDDVPDDLAATLAQVHAAASAMLGDEDRADTVRRELAALTHAVQGHVNGHDGTSGDVAIESPATESHSRPPVTHPDWGSARRKAWHRARPRIRWKLIAGIAVLIGALVAGWVGLPRAWTELQAGWESLLGTEPPPRTLVPVPPLPDLGEAADSEDASPADSNADPDELDPPAPTAAGPITEVSLAVEGAECDVGQRCLIRTEVGMEPAGATRSVAWTLEIVDRCSGDTTSAPGVTVAAQPGWTQVWGNSELELPDGSALAVYAVTSSPAEAASPALLVPVNGSC